MRKSKQYSTNQALQRKAAEQIHVADLVEVLSFYPEDMTVDVKPLVMGIKEESFISRPPIMKVPVATISGNGIRIRPCYREGDIGCIVYLDYDTDNAFVSGKETKPLTIGCHTGKDGVFIGGVMCGETMPENFPAGSLVIGTEENYITFENNKIQIHGKVEIEGELKVNGKAVMTKE